MSSGPSDTPLVSVIMPVRNEEAAIEVAVRSVLVQSHPRLEVLVVDGCSEDRTREVVRALAAEDERVRLLDNPARVIPAALNVGLAAATGPIVARIDGHARVNVDYLRRGVAALTARPDLAGIGGRRIGVARTPIGRSVALALSSRVGVGNSINHYSRQPADTDHASFPMYRTTVARAVHGWDEQLHVNEDVDFDHRVRALGHRLAYDPDMEIYWHVREDLFALGHQYRRYGRGKGAMILKNGPRALAARHLAPPALIVAFTLAALAAVLGRPRPAVVMGIPYALVVGTGAAAAWVGRPRGEPVSLPALPAALVAMHVAWGVGFLEGLLARRRAAAGSLVHPRSGLRRRRQRTTGRMDQEGPGQRHDQPEGRGEADRGAVGAGE